MLLQITTSLSDSRGSLELDRVRIYLRPAISMDLIALRYLVKS
jgi:hypothetical protein